MHRVQDNVLDGVVTWRTGETRVRVCFTAFGAEPAGHLDTSERFPIGVGLPLRLDDGRTTLAVIVGPDNHFMAVRPLE